MGRTGLSSSSGLLLTMALICIPAAYRAGEMVGLRDGEMRGARAMEASLDARFGAWLHTDKTWLDLRELIFSENIRPSTVPYWRNRSAKRLVGLRD